MLENRPGFSSQVFALGGMVIVRTGLSHSLDVFLPNVLCALREILGLVHGMTVSAHALRSTIRTF